jgi:hypothetical protein
MINLGFKLRENLAAIFITPSSWGSQWAGHLLGIKQSILAPLSGRKRRLLQGEFSHAHPLLCFKFCFTLFLLASFYYQKPKKKLESLIVVFNLSALSLLKWLLLKIPSCVILLA